MTRDLAVKVELGQLLRLSRGFLRRPTTPMTSTLILATHSLASEDLVIWLHVNATLVVDIVSCLPAQAGFSYTYAAFYFHCLKFPSAILGRNHSVDCQNWIQFKRKSGRFSH